MANRIIDSSPEIGLVVDARSMRETRRLCVGFEIIAMRIPQRHHIGLRVMLEDRIGMRTTHAGWLVSVGGLSLQGAAADQPACGLRGGHLPSNLRQQCLFFLLGGFGIAKR